MTPLNLSTPIAERVETLFDNCGISEAVILNVYNDAVNNFITAKGEEAFAIKLAQAEDRFDMSTETGTYQDDMHAAALLVNELIEAVAYSRNLEADLSR